MCEENFTDYSRTSCFRYRMSNMPFIQNRTCVASDVVSPRPLIQLSATFCRVKQYLHTL